MEHNEQIRIETIDAQNNHSFWPTATELEARINPLVVIAIIAILVGMLMPAVWK